MTVDAGAAVRDRLVEDLRLAGCVFAEDEADAALEAFTAAAGAIPGGAAASVEARVNDYVERRRLGVPSEYIIGWAEVAGTRVRVGPGVFIPRRWSESMVRRAAVLLEATGGGCAVDLGAGSGALALAAAAASPSSTVWACEIDPAAADWARINCAGAPRVHVRTGDLYAALPETLRHQVDVVFGSLPYVPREHVPALPRDHTGHEPVRAFDGGPGGLALITRALHEAGWWLKPGGHILLELGAGQGGEAAVIATAAGLSAVAVATDDDGGELFIEGRS